MSKNSNCLSCSDPIALASDVVVGEIVQCGACGQELEVLAVSPEVTIGLAPEVEEDWGE